MITEAQLTQCVRWQSYIISPIMACSATAYLKTNIKAITGNMCCRQCCFFIHSDLCSNALLEMCMSSVMGHYSKCVPMNYHFLGLNTSSSRYICDEVCGICMQWLHNTNEEIYCWCWYTDCCSEKGRLHLENGKSDTKCPKSCSVTLI